MPYPLVNLRISRLIPGAMVIIALCFIITALPAQELNDKQQAFSLAGELNRPVLMVFAGSDWCAPCIRFNKEILKDTGFIHFAKENLVILVAEFPQKKKLSPELIKQNEDLAERYNPSGLFPHLLLLNSGGEVITILDHRSKSAEEFAGQISKHLTDKPALQEFKTRTTLMGCTFEFTIVDSVHSDHGWMMVKRSIEEVQRIEGLISEWSDTTQISKVNRQAGKSPVAVDGEVYRLIQRSKSISEMTQGAFDISFGGAGKNWKLDADNTVIPDSGLIRKALEQTGYDKIILLDSNRVMLEKTGMQIGFGAIGKGYAAECVKQMLVSEDITAGVVNASGDLTAWGKRPDGSVWKAGIADPSDPSRVLLWLPVENAAVATSGNYEKFIEIEGRRYSHILDPRTGYPVSGIRSVTVISPNAELSDALATAVFVMGVETGLDFINQLPETHCIIIDENNKIHHSSATALNIEH